MSDRTRRVADISPVRAPGRRETAFRERGLQRYLVLGLLREGIARHGYALMKEFQRGSGTRMSSGRFYNTLQRLTAEGLVAAAANPSGADPRRTPYRITSTGVACFDTWVRNAAPSDTLRDDDLCTRAFLLATAEPATVSATLTRWRAEMWMRGATIEEACAAAKRRPHRAGFDVLPLFLARRLKHAAADMEFLDDFRRAYDRWTSWRASARSSPLATEMASGRHVPGRP